MISFFHNNNCATDNRASAMLHLVSQTRVELHTWDGEYSCTDG